MTPIETLVEELRAAGNPRDQKTGPSRELYRRAADALTTSNTALADARAELERVTAHWDIAIAHWNAAIAMARLHESRAEAAEATIETLRAALADINLDITLADGISRGFDLKPTLAKLARAISQGGGNG